MSQIFIKDLSGSFYLLQQTIYKRNISHEEVIQTILQKIVSNQKIINNYIEENHNNFKSTQSSAAISIYSSIENETSTTPQKNIYRILESELNDIDTDIQLSAFINKQIIKLFENFTPDNKLDIIDPILINHALIILEITNSVLIEITKHRVIKKKRRDPIKEQQSVITMNVARKKQDQARQKKTPEFKGVADVVKYIDKNYIKWQQKFIKNPKDYLIPRHFKAWFKNNPNSLLSEYYKKHGKTTLNSYINEQTRNKIK